MLQLSLAIHMTMERWTLGSENVGPPWRMGSYPVGSENTWGERRCPGCTWEAQLEARTGSLDIDC